jgi:electron transfer flavoprotein alpha/beta subunit
MVLRFAIDSSTFDTRTPAVVTVERKSRENRIVVAPPPIETVGAAVAMGVEENIAMVVNRIGSSALMNSPFLK